MDELATTISKETGMAKWLSQIVQVGLPINSFKSAAVDRRGATRSRSRSATRSIVREPIGVVGCITPWNYPLHQIAAKVAYAMAAGCTVVLKPSEVAPVDAFVLAEVIDEVGLPAGVFNLVSGSARRSARPSPPTPTSTWCRSPARPAPASASPSSAPRRSRRSPSSSAASRPTCCSTTSTAEGFAKAVDDGVQKAFLNSGQTCSALTRMLVPADRLDEAEQIAAAAVAKVKVGDPFTEGVHLGPLASAAQRDRVQGYIQKGIDEGADGRRRRPRCARRPRHRLLRRARRCSRTSRPDMTIAQEEIFGPVLSILPYDDEDEAVEIANGVVYGLAGGVWSADKDHAVAVARRLRTGQVEVNGGAFNPNAPFGGYKQSGIGREYGAHGLEEFLETKSLQL